MTIYECDRCGTATTDLVAYEGCNLCKPCDALPIKYTTEPEPVPLLVHDKFGYLVPWFTTADVDPDGVCPTCGATGFEPCKEDWE